MHVYIELSDWHTIIDWPPAPVPSLSYLPDQCKSRPGQAFHLWAWKGPTSLILLDSTAMKKTRSEQMISEQFSRAEFHVRVHDILVYFDTQRNCLKCLRAEPCLPWSSATASSRRCVRACKQVTLRSRKTTLRNEWATINPFTKIENNRHGLKNPTSARDERALLIWGNP